MFKQTIKAFWLGILMMNFGLSYAVDSSQENLYQHEEARFLMGTLARIQVSAPTQELAVQCAAEGFRALVLADSIFSTWRSDSEMSQINDLAGKGPVHISDTLADVLVVALDISSRSHGAFDPTVLPLVELWGFRNSLPGPPPDDQAIDHVLEAVGAGLVHYRADQQTVEFTNPRTGIDFGALAKGAAQDQAASAMLKCGAVGGMLDLGGGLLLFGQTEVQHVGIINPLDPDNPLDVISLTTGSIATSGQYERYRESEDRTWGHILDPRTGRPCELVQSVTVVTEKAILADALATACFVLGPVDGLRLLEETPRCEGLILFESVEGKMTLWFTHKWKNPTGIVGY